MRIIYSVLSAFSPSVQTKSNGSISSPDSGLAKFNSVSGEWQIYLGMAVIMEILVIGTYVGFGITLPISKEDDNYRETYSGSADHADGSNFPMGRR